MHRLSARTRVLQLAVVASLAFSIGAATVVVAVGGITGADRLVHLCLNASSGTLRAIADTDTCRQQESRLAVSTREYVDAAIAAEAAARASAETGTLASARSYTDTQVAGARAHTDTQVTAARSYTDTQTAAGRAYTDAAVGGARAYTDTAVAATRTHTDTEVAAARAYTDTQIAAIGDAITVVTVTVNTTTARPARTETYIEMVPVYAPIGDGSAGYQIVGYREETRTRIIAAVEETLVANAQCPAGHLSLAGHGLATPGTVALTGNGPAAASGAAPTTLSAFTGWAATARFTDTGSLTSRAFCTAAP